MEDLDALVAVLSRGGVVACPTETWVGLLADARDNAAVERVAELKGRPTDLPIALLLPDARSIATVAAGEIPPSAQGLIDRYWPGPLTLLVSAAAGLSPRLTQDGKVGVRVPGPSRAADLVRAFGHPVTATSANLSGEPPVRSAAELPKVLLAQIDGQVAGLAPGGPPSTLVDATIVPIRVVRAGAIDLDVTAL